MESIKFINFDLLNQDSSCQHFISTRKGGVSKGLYSSLNLSFKVGDNPEHVIENRKRIANEMGISIKDLIIPDQCHTDRVRVLTGRPAENELASTDALITHKKGLCLCVLTADCVPVLLCDPQKKVIAAVHAGWRGTASRIVSRTLELMIRVFGSKPENILAGIGPAISQMNYEVGVEVVNRFEFLFSDCPEIFWKNTQTGKTHIDLQAANRVLLQRGGLSEEHIQISQICTFANSDLLYSARRDGLKCGRFGAGIMLT